VIYELCPKRLSRGTLLALAFLLPKECLWKGQRDSFGAVELQRILNPGGIERQ